MTSTDSLAIIGVVAIFLALWIIYPALAILGVGTVILSTAVGLALLKRREAHE